MTFKLPIATKAIPALISALLFTCVVAFSQNTSTVTAIKAGRLVDPVAGTILNNQVIIIENGKFKEIGSNLAIPAGAEVIDLSALTVMPGLVDARNHLALTY